ncbi:MAG: secondary thiamine-phosphate synthase enzyme YjbQ [Sedimentisphaerales bacterium]|nr:secondary thiamine-phosphate synthase enzyme YjbQ [Sedimentisphaerales bacterium]
MKIVTKDFHISTKQRCEFVDITSQVASFINKSGIKDGDAIVYCPHTTAGITVNENADRSVVHDILLTLEELVPRLRAGYQHDEGNSDAHCKSSLIGCSKQFVIRDGQLVLGTWQGIFFCEFDGPRSRSFIVQVRGE